jgi:transmembrane sensor
VGTQFDVYRKATGAVVTVLEGRVAVSSGGSARGAGGEGQMPHASSRAVSEPASERAAGPGDTILVAGEQMAVTADSAVKPSKPDVSAATAWLRHEIVFSGTPLGDVVEEFNRYNERRLVIRDASLESLKISGVFSATDLPSLIRFLRAQPGIVVTEGDREIRIGTN